MEEKKKKFLNAYADVVKFCQNLTKEEQELQLKVEQLEGRIRVISQKGLLVDSEKETLQSVVAELQAKVDSYLRIQEV